MKLQDRIAAQIDALQANPVELDANSLLSLLFDCNAELASGLHRAPGETQTIEANELRKTLAESRQRVEFLETELSLFADLFADQKEKLKGKVLSLVNQRIAPDIIKDIDASKSIALFMRMKREIEAGFTAKYQAQDHAAPISVVSVKPFQI